VLLFAGCRGTEPPYPPGKAPEIADLMAAAAPSLRAIQVPRAKVRQGGGPAANLMLVAQAPARFSGTIQIAGNELEADKIGALVREYLNYLKIGGRLVCIVPQESGYKTDPTHRTFLQSSDLEQLEESLGLRHERAYSFPFARAVGRVFPYNETVSLSTKVAPT
jgi:hypothetical protein